MKRLAWSWFVVVLCGCAWLAIQVTSRPAVVVSDLLSLLPAAQRDPRTAEVIDRIARQGEQQFVVAVEAPDSEVATQMGRFFEKSMLNAAPELRRLTVPDPRAVLPFYTDRAANFLPEPVSESLSTVGGVVKFLDAGRAFLHSPYFNGSLADLMSDPLLIIPARLLASGGSAIGVDEYGNLLVEGDSGSIVLLRFGFDASPFSREFQEELTGAYDVAFRETLVKYPAFRARRAGLVWVSMATARTMEREVTLLNGIGLALTVLLFFLVFRSLSTVILTLVPLLVGSVTAFSITLLVFPTLHAVTIAFGSVLIGGCTDYGIHYLTARSSEPDGHRTMRTVLPGLTLGMITSVLAFAGLLITPLPILQQIAIYCSCGLAAAYITVVLWLPFGPPVTCRPALLAGMRRLLGSLHDERLRMGLVALVITGLAVSALYGLPFLTVNDDLRILTRPDSALLDNERKIQELLNAPDLGRFLLVEGKTEAEALEREAAARKSIESAVTSSEGVTTFVPAPSIQKKSIAAIVTLCEDHQSDLLRYAEQVGLSNESITNFCNRARKAVPVTVADLEGGPLGESVKFFWLGRTADGVASVVRLKGIRDEDAIRNAVVAGGARYVNRVSEMSALLKQYRERAAWLTGAAYAVVVLVMLLRYGVRRGICVLAPPVAGAVASLSFMGITGASISVFSLFGILMALGLAVDFAVFFEEGEGHEETTLLAVLVSALTSLLTFGLLSFSSAPMLQQFGVTVCAGVFCAMLLSPCVSRGRRV